MKAATLTVTATAVAVLLTGCSPAATAPAPNAPPSRVTAPSASAPASPVMASPSPDERLAAAVDALERGVRAPGARLEVSRRPSLGAPSRAIAARNPLDQRLVFLATDTVERDGTRWYQILLPRRPNGSQGWVRTDDVRTVKLRDRIEVDLSRTTLTRFEDGRRVARYPVGVGQRQWPTPTGTYYVWALVPQPSPAGPYGSYALGLSGFSPVLTDWPGGGRFAIHGTPRPWDTGKRVSHGCIRVFNRDVNRLRDVPMGTPVIITR